jgi:hypothetical protein
MDSCPKITYHKVVRIPGEVNEEYTRGQNNRCCVLRVFKRLLQSIPKAILIFINDIDEEAEGIGTLRKFANNTKLAHGINSKEDGDKLRASLD